MKNFIISLMLLMFFGNCSFKPLIANSAGKKPSTSARQRTSHRPQIAPKPRYENPGTHDPNGGANPYNPTKSVLPKNHEALFRASKIGPDGSRWTKVGTGKTAEIHRFQLSAEAWHWNGSTKGMTLRGKPRIIEMHDVPIEVKRW